jgi:hypothetical protein
MEGRCEKHPFERMERNCRTCGGEFCADCLVYAYGAKKPPYCVSCALAAAGVRSTAARPQVRSKRDLRRETREQKRKEKLAAKARVEVDASLLLEARPVGAPAVGPGHREEMAFELTITDDGRVLRDEPSAVTPPPPPPPVPPVEVAETVPASKSIFDY